MKQNGFTLIEVLLYVGILAMITGLFTGILTVAARFQVNQSASNEVSQQLNFTMQTIQRLVRESSVIEEVGTDNDDTTTTEIAYLKLRMKEPAKDPTCVALVDDDNTGPGTNGSIFVTAGPAAVYPDDKNCKNPVTTDRIITNKVTIPLTPTAGLVFTKFANPPGHDTVQIDLTLNYNTTNPQSQVARTLTTAIGRVSAATFDSSLTPGIGSFNIGDISNKWNEIYVEKIMGQFKQPNNYGASSGRGFLTVGAPGSSNCSSLCSAHADSCLRAFEFITNAGTGNLELKPINCLTQIGSTNRGLCFCD